MAERLRAVSPGRIECSGIPDRTGYPVERTGRERQRHKSLVRAGKRGKDPELACNSKTKLRIIRRVADNDNDPVPKALAFLQSLFYQGCTDPKALEVLVNGEGGKGEGGSLRPVRDYRDRREKNVPDDPVTVDSHERELVQVVPVISQGIHEPGLAILAERLEIDLENSVCILGSFLPDDKGVHPFLLDGRADKGIF